MSLWQRSKHPSQQSGLDSLPSGQRSLITFFNKDLGDYTLFSVLDGHPLAQEFEIKPGAICVRFASVFIVISEDGEYFHLPASLEPI